MPRRIIRWRRTFTLPSWSSASSGVGPPGVGAGRAPEPSQVVPINKSVVGCEVLAKPGIVPLGAKGQRRPALPAAHDLGAEQCLIFAARRLGPEVLAVSGDTRMKLSENHVSAVAAEHLRRRHGREPARFVEVTEDELARLYGTLARVGPLDPARFHSRLADAVLEPERRAPHRELVAVLAPDRLHARQLLVRPPGTLEHLLQLLGVA